MSAMSFTLEYRYPQNTGALAYPKAATDICAAINRGLLWHRTTSVLLVLSIIALAAFFFSREAGIVAFCVFVAAAVFKVIVLATMGVSLEYKMDQNWRNFANTRMAPFTYMSKTKRLWEVTSSSGGYDKKYHAGCSVQVQRKEIRVVYSVPFPFKPSVNAYTLYLPDRKFVFLPDCVYMIQGSSCEALHYEHIKWSSSMTIFVESSAPKDSQVVGQTWQYVNKKGGPDRRFSYNPMLVECSYGRLDVNFANRRRAELMLSGTRVAESIMRLPPCR